jgi:hypothetical protein
MIAAVQTTLSINGQDGRAGNRKVPRWVHGVAIFLVVSACVSALYFSGWGMWHFIDHKLGVDGWHRILPMFLLFDLAGIASAWLARIRRIEEGKTGVAGLLVWLFAVLSGLMSATDATTWGGQSIRFAAPLVAAVMFELLISGERRAAIGTDNTTLARVARRLKARFGLLDTLEQNDQAAARAAVAGRVAVLAYRVHAFDEARRSSLAYRRAVRKYHRRLRTATERFGFGGDAEMVGEVRLHLATLYRSLTDTTELAVADINPWQSAVRATGRQPVRTAAELTELIEQAGSDLSGVKRPSEQAGQVEPGDRFAAAGSPAELADPLDPASDNRRQEPTFLAPVELAPARLPVQMKPTSRTERIRGRRADEEVLEEYGERLLNELRTTGRLTRYRVEQVCGVSARQAGRVLTIVEERTNLQEVR